jgi:Holliday junction resolvase
MNQIYLHREDLESILKFLNTFQDKDIVLVSSDTSSGIGALIKASVIGANVGGHVVTVTKDIVDESSW